MSKRPRRNHAACVQGQGALEAIEGEKTVMDRLPAAICCAICCAGKVSLPAAGMLRRG